MWEYIFWGIIFVAALITEAATVAFVSIWLAVGALIAFLIAVAGASFSIQCIFFVLVSLVLFLCTRPLAKKLGRGKRVATNADSVIGMEGIVKEPIRPLSTGRVCVRGLDWSARTTGDDQQVPAGARIVVEQIQGATLIVRPVETVVEAQTFS